VQEDDIAVEADDDASASCRKSLDLMMEIPSSSQDDTSMHTNESFALLLKSPAHEPDAPAEGGRNMSTAIVLRDATHMLYEVIKQNDKTCVCSVCFAPFHLQTGNESKAFAVCGFNYVAVEQAIQNGTHAPGALKNYRHKVHTACRDCMLTKKYIFDNQCVVCYTRLKDHISANYANKDEADEKWKQCGWMIGLPVYVPAAIDLVDIFIENHIQTKKTVDAAIEESQKRAEDDAIAEKQASAILRRQARAIKVLQEKLVRANDDLEIKRKRVNQSIETGRLRLEADVQAERIRRQKQRQQADNEIEIQRKTAEDDVRRILDEAKVTVDSCRTTTTLEVNCLVNEQRKQAKDEIEIERKKVQDERKQAQDEIEMQRKKAQDEIEIQLKKAKDEADQIREACRREAEAERDRLQVEAQQIVRDATRRVEKDMARSAGTNDGDAGRNREVQQAEPSRQQEEQQQVEAAEAAERERLESEWNKVQSEAHKIVEDAKRQAQQIRKTAMEDAKRFKTRVEAQAMARGASKQVRVLSHHSSSSGHVDEEDSRECTPPPEEPVVAPSAGVREKRRRPAAPTHAPAAEDDEQQPPASKKKRPAKSHQPTRRRLPEPQAQAQQQAVSAVADHAPSTPSADEPGHSAADEAHVPQPAAVADDETSDRTDDQPTRPPPPQKKGKASPQAQSRDPQLVQAAALQGVLTRRKNKTQLQLATKKIEHLEAHIRELEANNEVEKIEHLESQILALEADIEIMQDTIADLELANSELQEELEQLRSVAPLRPADSDASDLLLHEGSDGGARGDKE